MSTNIDVNVQGRTGGMARRVGSAGGRRLPWRRLTWGTALLVALAGLSLTLWPAPSPAQSAPLASDFALPLVWNGTSGATNGALSLRGLRGHPVLLNFFYSTCPSCVEEMPALRQASRDYQAAGVQVVGIATNGDTPDVARRFASVERLPYRVVVDGGEQATSWAYQVGGFPTNVFLDAQGRIRGRYSQELDAPTIRAALSGMGVTQCDASCQDAKQSDQQPATLGTTLPGHTPPFALRDQNGRLISLDALRGKVVALTFISDECKEQCPLVGQTLARARRDLGADANRFAIVAISIAPEEDSPAAIQSFARHSGWLGTDWHYLSAPRPVLERVWKSYFVDIVPQAPIFLHPQLVHDAAVYMIDPHGQWRTYNHAPFLAQDIAAQARALLHGS